MRRAGSRSAYRAIRLGAAFFFPQVLGQTQVVNCAMTGATDALQVLGHTHGRNWAVWTGAVLARESVRRSRFIMDPVYRTRDNPHRRTVNAPV